MRWIDHHCHLEAGPSGDALVAEARAAGVARLIVVGTDGAQSRQAVEVAAAHEGVWATAGVHPHDASGGLDGIAELLDRPEVVAVGECGLDYHYDHSPRPVQREVFARQIGLAHEHDLALVIHTREAWEDTFEILAAEGVPERAVLHCFTGGPREARRALDLGLSLSFSGIVTFKRADDLREAVACCPLERVLVETDSPYLAPEPHRGRPNRPALVPLVGAAVARAGGWSVEEVAETTWRNAERLYRLPPSPAS
ncbi:TatD family hydrolase [Rhabdothermincola sp.]|uniref:TatD family hydrolase n=1 Tax=Rhabdothermincola sp. TaxID=2820405 RepID=UPI002FE2B186